MKMVGDDRGGRYSMFCRTGTNRAWSGRRDVERRNREVRVAVEEKRDQRFLQQTSSRKKTRVGSGSMFTFLQLQPIKSSQILTAPKERGGAKTSTSDRAMTHPAKRGLSSRDFKYFRPGGSSNAGSTKTWWCSHKQRRLYDREDPLPPARCRPGDAREVVAAPLPNMTNRNPMRLPPLPQLRVRNPNKPEPNPCLGVMTSVLGKRPSQFMPLSSN